VRATCSARTANHPGLSARAVAGALARLGDEDGAQEKTPAQMVAVSDVRQAVLLRKDSEVRRAYLDYHELLERKTSTHWVATPITTYRMAIATERGKMPTRKTHTHTVDEARRVYEYSEERTVYCKSVRRRPARINGGRRERRFRMG
jgi:hypothetical protein